MKQTLSSICSSNSSTAFDANYTVYEAHDNFSLFLSIISKVINYLKDFCSYQKQTNISIKLL